MITESQKWHVSGRIIDASPEPERVPADYFERLQEQRKKELLQQFKADEDALAQTMQKIKGGKSNPSASTSILPFNLQLYCGAMLL